MLCYLHTMPNGGLFLTRSPKTLSQPGSGAMPSFLRDIIPKQIVVHLNRHGMRVRTKSDLGCRTTSRITKDPPSWLALRMAIAVLTELIPFEREPGITWRRSR